MQHSQQDARRETIDPLTGRKMHLALQNGFSGFGNDVGFEMPESCFTALQSKADCKITGRKDNEAQNEHVLQHQCDLSLKHGHKVPTGIPAIPLSFSLKPFSKTLIGQESSYMQEFLESWNNPVFGVAKDTALSAQVGGCFPIRKRSINLEHQIALSKSSLKNLQVIGQVDSKFMACKSTHETNNKESKDFLLLVDQHAAHERIRLENLQEEFLSLTTKAGSNTGNIISKNLNPPVQLSLTLSSQQSLQSFRKEYEKIGIKFTIQNEMSIADKKYVSIYVNSLPLLFVTSRKNGDVIHPILGEARLKELFYEHLKVLDSSPSVIPVIPPAINSVLSSYACHGAIKFGDRLSDEECRALLHLLARCKLPFQCAHGRPSIAPLINLTAHSLKDSKPQLWKLRKRNKT